ncbi:hypothetical protein [Shewanella sp. CG12_big_fil_rev_8_21_14_0_65_47_15]|uniref:hypothetical protein n=1 Tax=Shewanella sp. CG12_big_fil_rev_8_21_14_0_65_47_15 TaxID=1975537 RepID=UPI000CC3B8A8|nr:hypothetical protein [Shewanella sp. CG12_big_fil_rev_8_21_14_0_65_47_15]PIW61787.1 MAG: hypothetical protein COW15_06280 [Shewanella sp. CG12_big_fil_rev_8_21_14_0_65_47_15]
MKELSIEETEVVSGGGVGSIISGTIPGIIVGKIVDKAMDAWTSSDQYQRNMEVINNSSYHRYMNGSGERSWGGGNGGGVGGGGGGGGGTTGKYLDRKLKAQ